MGTDDRRNDNSNKQKETDLQRTCRKAAERVLGDFESSCGLRNKSRESAIAVFDPDEIIVKKWDDEGLLYKGNFTCVARVDGVELMDDSGFEDDMEDLRDRVADRVEDGHFAIKYVNPEAVKGDKKQASHAGAAIMIEAKILMNLAPHPHICNLYGLNASGTDVIFGGSVPQESLFLLIDSISETLPQRMKSWREKKSYHEGERFDELKRRQAQVTQRLEVALDVCSPMVHLAGRNVVYCFHPEKVGFDSRYKRVKLFHFGEARESGKGPLTTFLSEDMMMKAYLAPEIIRGDTVTVQADVYSFGLLLWQIMTLRHPFDGMRPESHLEQVVNGKSRPPLNKTWPSNLRNLMENCWKNEDRITMKQVYDDLEECLLFPEFDGIDRTEDHDMRKEPAKRSRRIRYVKKEDTIPEEGGGKDARSVRSRESARSRESKRSHKSDGSGDKSHKSDGSGQKSRSSRPLTKEKSRAHRDTKSRSSSRDSEEASTSRPRSSSRDQVDSGRENHSSQKSRSKGHEKKDKGDTRGSSHHDAKRPSKRPDENDDSDVVDYTIPLEKEEPHSNETRPSRDKERSLGRSPSGSDSDVRAENGSRPSMKDRHGKIRRASSKTDVISNEDSRSRASKSTGSRSLKDKRGKIHRSGSKSDIHAPDGTASGDGSSHKDTDRPQHSTSVKDRRGKIHRSKSRENVFSNEDVKSVGSASLSKKHRPVARRNSKVDIGDETSGQKVDDNSRQKSPKERRGKIRRTRSKSDLTSPEETQSVGSSSYASQTRPLSRRSSKIDTGEDVFSSSFTGWGDEGESGGGRSAPARRGVARARSSDGGALFRSPIGARQVSRRRSGDDLLQMTAALQRGAGPTRGIARQKSIERGLASVLSPRASPRTRGVGRSKSADSVNFFATADWDEDSNERSIRSGGRKKPGSSLGFISDENEKASAEKSLSLEMSEHSRWVELGSKGGSNASDPFRQYTAPTNGLVPSSKDLHGSRDPRKAMLEKSKEKAMAEAYEAEESRKTSYQTQVHLAAQGRKAPRKVKRSTGTQSSHVAAKMKDVF